MEFIYLGQCEVGQGGLEAFLLAGREFKVNGLMGELEGLQEHTSLVSKHGSTDHIEAVPEKKEPARRTLLGRKKLRVWWSSWQERSQLMTKLLSTIKVELTTPILVKVMAKFLSWLLIWTNMTVKVQKNVMILRVN